ncbi:MAG TPA: dTMP kinase [Candidatus Polarisedimenticolia bacterium]|nr:dTMP kinase [Candidatus Polarisedimenticolia bacterium]
MGCFITFEGIEGSGKSTQIRLLFEHLKGRDLDVKMTREPGGTLIGERVRSILLDPSTRGLIPRAELLLYAAARVQHIEEVIQPALDEGKVVLCDRFMDATVAYQGYGREVPLNVVKVVNSLVAIDLKPDLTILLDLPVEVGLKRARERNQADAASATSRFEEEDQAFHQRVREGYLELAAAERGRVKIVPADQPVEKVAKQIQQLAARAPGLA